MQHVLYISPVLPRRCGHGGAQRAFRVLEALAHRFRVSLLTTERTEANPDTADATTLCESVAAVRLTRWTGRAIGRRVLRTAVPAMYYHWFRRPSDWRTPSAADRRILVEASGRNQFDRVHVHRLYMLPLLRSCPALADLPVTLDLDDVESVTRNRIADLARLNGDRRTAYLMRSDADMYRAIERRELPGVDRVFVCSEIDRTHLIRERGLDRVDVLPNVVEVPEPAPPRAVRAAGSPFVFLFVGTQDYYPNRDAVSFFCRDVAPLVRARASGPFQVRVVGGGSPGGRERVLRIPELSWAPSTADLAREYAAAGAAIVPIRAGGGTRIKALEAFAHRVPVIATTIGVEGLDVEHGRHALVGQTPGHLADHAVAVMNDAGLREGLAGRALAFVRASNTPAVLRLRVEEVMGA